MAKKRKTRQEKVIADLRRQLQTQASPPQAKTVTNSQYLLPQTNTVAIGYTRQVASSYIIADLKKTAVLTFIALAAQIGLYFALL